MRPASTFLLAVALAASAAPRAAAQDRDRDHDRDDDRGRSERHLPEVTSISVPFFADASDAGRDRAFAVVIVKKTARVPAEWPLVIQASMMVDGDPAKGPAAGVSCAPAIDGHRGVLTPLPQPPDPAPPSSVDAAPAPGLFPNLHWFGNFSAGPIPRGTHTFTVECVGATPFQLRGTVSVNVFGNPSGR
jgi:hypothetical protein